MLVRAADQLPITDRVQNGAMTSVTHKAKTQGSVEARAEKQHWSRFGFLKYGLMYPRLALDLLCSRGSCLYLQSVWL